MDHTYADIGNRYIQGYAEFHIQFIKGKKNEEKEKN